MSSTQRRGGDGQRRIATDRTSGAAADSEKAQLAGPQFAFSPAGKCRALDTVPIDLAVDVFFLASSPIPLAPTFSPCRPVSPTPSPTRLLKISKYQISLACNCPAHLPASLCSLSALSRSLRSFSARLCRSERTYPSDPPSSPPLSPPSPSLISVSLDLSLPSSLSHKEGMTGMRCTEEMHVPPSPPPAHTHAKYRRRWT